MQAVSVLKMTNSLAAILFQDASPAWMIYVWHSRRFDVSPMYRSGFRSGW